VAAGGVRVVAEEQAELAHPEHLVHQPGESRGEEQREGDAAFPAASDAAFPAASGRARAA
jgi:hypothetical protein